MKLKFIQTKDDHIRVETKAGFYIGSFFKSGEEWFLDLLRTQVSVLGEDHLRELSMKSNILNSKIPQGIHLKINYYSLYDMGIKIHPIEIMNELGIRFTSAVQKWGEYWFIDCKNVPEDLPTYITRISDEVVYGYGEVHT